MTYFLLLLAGAMLVLSAQAAKPSPGVVILCESGGVYRSLDSAEGFVASGGPCVLHDSHGGHSTADMINVYDATRAAP